MEHPERSGAAYPNVSGAAEPDARRIPLTRSQVALVDAADYEWLSQWTWQYQPPQKEGYTGYARRGVRGREGPGKRNRRSKHTVYMHRLIAGLDGLPRSAGEIDHRNHDGLDNRRANLRVTDGSENCHNRRPIGRGASGVVGVQRLRWSQGKEAWLATIDTRGQGWHLGIFPTVEAAAAVRQAAEEAVAAGLPLDQVPHLSARKQRYRPLRTE